MAEDDERRRRTAHASGRGDRPPRSGHRGRRPPVVPPELRPDLEPAVQVSSLTLEVTFADRRYSVPTLIRVLEAFDNLWTDLAQLDLYVRGEDRIPFRSTVERPQVQRLSKQSPLVISLTGGSVLLSTFVFVRYFLTHPDQVGGLVPRIVQHWHEGWKDAERAKADRALEAALRVDRNTVLASLSRPPGEELQLRIEQDTASVIELAGPTNVELTSNVPVPVARRDG